MATATEKEGSADEHTTKHPFVQGCYRAALRPAFGWLC